MTTFLLQSDLAVELIEEASRDAARREEVRIRPIVETQVRESMKGDIEAANAQRELLAAAVSEAQARLEQVNVELARVEGARSELTAQVDAARQQVRQFSSGLERQLQSLSPREVPYARALLERLRDVLGDAYPCRLPTSAPPWTSPMDSGEASVVTLQTLSESLQLRAESGGLTSLLELDAFARAGEVVLLLGNCVEQALEVYSDTVGAGKVWTLALDPSFIGLDDLWAAPPERSPTGFAMAWSRAEAHPDEAVIVCLRAIDASPMHLWLPPLAAVLRSRGRPRNLLVVATALGTEHEISDYPNHASLLEWLVPFRAVASENGLRVLGSLTGGGLQKTVLKFPEGAIRSMHPLTSEQVVALSRLVGDSVKRVARLAMVMNPHASANRIVAEWVAVLESPDAGAQHAWLGTDDLKRLRHQD
jgi:hypothetical protein